MSYLIVLKQLSPFQQIFDRSQIPLNECNIDNISINVPKITIDQTNNSPFYDYT